MANRQPSEAPREKTYFEQQREVMLGDIAMVRSQVEARVRSLTVAELRTSPRQHQQAESIPRSNHHCTFDETLGGDTY